MHCLGQYYFITPVLKEPQHVGGYCTLSLNLTKCTSQEGLKDSVWNSSWSWHWIFHVFLGLVHRTEEPVEHKKCDTFMSMAIPWNVMIDRWLIAAWARTKTNSTHAHKLQMVVSSGGIHCKRTLTNRGLPHRWWFTRLPWNVWQNGK